MIENIPNSYISYNFIQTHRTNNELSQFESEDMSVRHRMRPQHPFKITAIRFSNAFIDIFIYKMNPQHPYKNITSICFSNILNMHDSMQISPHPYPQGNFYTNFSTTARLSVWGIPLISWQACIPMYTCYN